MNWFKNKRLQVAKSLSKKSALVLASSVLHLRQPDVHYPYRQDSNFYYLTGFTDPCSLFILLSGSKPRSILFIADKNIKTETWNGWLPSKQQVKKKYQIDEVFYLSELDKKLPVYFKGINQVFYNKKINSFFDKKMRSFTKASSPAENLLAPFREIKDKTEISWMKKSIAVTKHGHAQVARHLKNKVNEGALHGIFIKSIMEKNSLREAYGSIVACGDNANTLHYIKNDSLCKKGELLLIDAGAEMHHYASDVTRVYPVSNKFSKKQKLLYEHLLNLQKNLIKQVRPGVSMEDLNIQMKEGITHILLKMNIIKGSFEQHLQKNTFHKYCPHSVGHLLGLDVHDPYFKDRKDLVLQKGMVITIEPGIYISKDDKNVDKDLRAIGLRIEDDILVTSKSQENLTRNIPKEVKAVEQLCSQKNL